MIQNGFSIPQTDSCALKPAEPMAHKDYGALLNALLEAERAGAKLLAAYLDELRPDSDQYAWLSGVQRAEARNCSVLIHLLLEAGFAPRTTVGSFYQKGLAIREWRERLEFLNRGQRWVMREVGAALPHIAHPAGKRFLKEMYESHERNVELCQRHLE